MGEKFKTLFSLVGIRSEVLPGISVAFFLVYFILFHFQPRILTSLGLQGMDATQSDTLLGIAAVLGSVVLWFISGAIWDKPVYNRLYGENRPWTRSPETKLMLFTSGYELEKFRKLARQKLARTNPLYADSNISIYAPIMENVSTGDPNRYKEIKGELQISKVFRNALLPVIFVAAWFLYKLKFVPAIVTVLLLFVFLAISFHYRALHSLRAYRWFVEKKEVARGAVN